MSVETLYIVGYDGALVIDRFLEMARYAYSRALIDLHGYTKTPDYPFDATKYLPMNCMDRCYDNAIDCACRYGLKYVEGSVIFKVSGGGPVPLAHGWCEDADGRIVDPTLHKMQGKAPCIYRGVPIKKDYAKRWRDRVGYFGCLDGDKNGRPIGVYFDDFREWLDK